MSEVERTLPDEQVKDSELEGGEMIAYEKAQRLTEQFEQIQTSTIGDGMLRAPVSSIEATSSNDSIAIEVDLPAETEDERFYMDKPKSWSRDYDFVRWVEHHGYRAGDFEGMIEKGVQVEVKREDGDYELVIPERVTDKTKNFKRRLAENALHVLEGARSREVMVISITSFVGGFLAMLFMAGAFLQGNVVGLVSVIALFGWIFGWAIAFFTAVVLE